MLHGTAKGNIREVFWEDGAQSAAAERDAVPERYCIRTDFDASALIPDAEIIGEKAYITSPLTEGEFAVLKGKILEHGSFLSKIPLFE